MLLYHGSYKKFTNFELKYAKEGKDYGKGIYFFQTQNVKNGIK